MKTCKICKKEKDIEDFYIHYHYKDNRMNICKECYSLKNKKYREKNKQENKKIKLHYYNQKDSNNSITFFLTKEIKKKFKIKTLENNTDMTKVLIEFIKKYVKD